MSGSWTDPSGLEAEVERVRTLDIAELRTLWRSTFGSVPPAALSKDLLARRIAWHLQEQTLGGLDSAIARLLAKLARGESSPETRRRLKPGTVLVREYQGERHTVTVVPGGFLWGDTTYGSLSTIARAITGTSWNGPRFFGVRAAGQQSDIDGGERRSISRNGSPGSTRAHGSKSRETSR
jgi:hypothetical protein